MKYDLVVFDLDGTLLNTAKGICNSVRYVEKKLHLAKISENQLPLFIGPPPLSMYRELYHLSDQEALTAAQYHREYARTQGLYEAEIYDGVVNTLNYLHTSGRKIAVATLKSQSIAERILSIFKLDIYIDAVIGMDEGESYTKADTIRMAMRATGIDKKVVLIGDSKYDLIGAQETGIDFIGVLYGFGFHEQNIPWPMIVKIDELIKMV